MGTWPSGLGSALCLTGGGNELPVGQPFLSFPGLLLLRPSLSRWGWGVSVSQPPEEARSSSGSRRAPYSFHSAGIVETGAETACASPEVISFRNEWAAPIAFSFQNVMLHFESA